ncbi:MAG TPA: hypothetical protein VIG86_10710 [Candidatus Dormibacteraeota bacterium]|jgi:hypothetical protein
MADTKRNLDRVLRFVASGGFADEDADMVAELLTNAHRMAEMIVADPTSSPELRRTATAFLEQLDSDTFGDY